MEEEEEGDVQLNFYYFSASFLQSCTFFVMHDSYLRERREMKMMKNIFYEDILGIV